MSLPCTRRALVLALALVLGHALTLGAAQDTPRFYITGHIVNPRYYALEAGTTVRRAIEMAGGVKERGATDGITIRRLVDRRYVILSVTLDTAVLDNDTISIPERLFYIGGPVTKPGLYLLEAGMTIRRGIEIAGGLVEGSTVETITIERLIDDATVILPATLDTLVQATDAIAFANKAP
jgi:protein involved in polysaccharide export with SLBB domain